MKISSRSASGPHRYSDHIQMREHGLSLRYWREHIGPYNFGTQALSSCVRRGVCASAANYY